MADILSPDEINIRRERKKLEEQEVIKKSITTQAENIAKGVKIEYESMGRFSTPAVLYFKDYSVDDINDIIMIQPEYLVETLVPILNKMKFGEGSENFDVAEMSVEDFTETLVALKKQYNTTKHIHPYMCDCQYSLPDSEQKMNEGVVDLNELKYKSIIDVEEEYKAQTKKNLDELSEEDWIEYVHSFFGNCGLWIK